MKHKYIDELEEGAIVLAHQPNYGDIAIVKRCVHGNLYYAYHEDDTTDTSTLPLVADADRNHIECCR